MSKLVVFGNKIADIRELELEDNFHESLKPEVSLADIVYDTMPRYKALGDMLGFEYVDLNDIDNNYYFIKEDLKRMVTDLPINMRILYITFLRKLENIKEYDNYTYLSTYIKNKSED